MLSRLLSAVLFGAFLSLIPPAQSQQTIFNVPSATETPRGQLFLQNEGQFRPWTPGAFYIGTQYQAVGIGYHTELDLTLFNVTAPKSGPMTLGVGFKSCVPVFKERFKKREFKVTVGEILPVALERAGGIDGVGNWTYAHVSGKLPGLKTRITAGVSVGTEEVFARNHVCFIGGYEQPVTERFTLQGDWFSGRHSLGLFIPGFSYAFPRDYTLYCGFQIPNYRQNGRTGFVVELAKILPLKGE
jgi:hypothetical protein